MKALIAIGIAGIAALVALVIALIAGIVYIFVARLGMPTVVEQAAGFWMGLWQGIIVLLSFIASLFDKSISIYQIGNNGNWYHFGYLLGLMISIGGSASRK